MTIRDSIEQASCFDVYAVITSIEKDKEAKDGRKFHVLTISDSTFSIKLYYWAPSCPFREEDYIKFSAEVVKGQFLSAKQGEVFKVEKNCIPEDREVLRVILNYTVDIASLSERAQNFINKAIKDNSWRILLNSVTDVSFLERVKEFPAGKSAHHALRGGLLKHVEEMFNAFEALYTVKQFSDLRAEFIILGIFVHDYFKYDEYRKTEEGFVMTDSAALLGHVFQAAAFVKALFSSVEKANNISFSKEDKDKAVHTVLAHHGELEWGSPVKPCIPEAIVLHYLDQLSAKLNMFSTANPKEFNKFLGVYIVK